MRKISLNVQILLGALFGVIIGVTLNMFSIDPQIEQSIIYTSEILGRIFIGVLKMILIPLVFTSIVIGITNLKAEGQMHRIWKLSLTYFLSTTALAVLTGLIAVNIFKPGQGLSMDMFAGASQEIAMQTMGLGSFAQTFISGLFLNPVAAMAQGKILPLLLFAILFSIALVVSGHKAQNVTKLMQELFDVIMLIVQWIMYLAPWGIMGLLVKMIASQNSDLLKQLSVFIAVVVFTLLFHGFCTLPLILKFVAKRKFIPYFRGIKNALLTAFSTSSSSATLPITMECVEDNLEVDKDVAGFVLPMGATINMDGTALYEAIAALFVANLVGIDLSLVQQIIVFFIAIVAAVGAPGIPSAGMVTMIMVLQSVGLPAEAIAILLPIDRLLDSFRTMINVNGDAIGACVVDRFVDSSI